MDKVRTTMGGTKKTVTALIRDADDVSSISTSEENIIMAKRRSLKLTFANLSKSDTLSCVNEFFKTGKLYNQPVDSIPPGHKQTIYVMNSEGLHLAGVSGGLSMGIKSKARRDEFLICTFSNPLVGCVKSSVFLSSEGGKDQIEALWAPMDECAIVKESFYGTYRESDKHVTFVWKDSCVSW